jgi:hypothetical protein
MLYRTKPRRTASAETLAAIPRGTEYTLQANANGTFTPVFDLAVSDSILKQGKAIWVNDQVIDMDYHDSLRMEQVRISNTMRGIRAPGFRSFDGQLI